MQNLKVNKDDGRLEIDLDGLRKNVFDKKVEVENIIKDFKAQLDIKWKELPENKKKGGNTSNNSSSASDNKVNTTSNESK